MPKRPNPPRRPRRPSPPSNPLDQLQQMFLDRAKDYMNQLMDQMFNKLDPHVFTPIAPPLPRMPKQKSAAARTLYGVLEVSQNASPEVISGAWRSLCKLFHPDIKPGNEKRMRSINDAYEILSDPQKRKLYDQHLRSQ